MKSAQGELREAVDGFVARLSDIMRRQSVEQVTRALGASFQANGNGHSRSAANGVGQKRSAEALAATVKEVGEYIAAHPGQGMEQIRVALGKTTAELMLPVQKLLRAKVITSKGQKRATRYFPSSKAAAKA